MSSDKFYWAITGRIPFDDEDTPFVTQVPCTRGEAETSFRNLLITGELKNEAEDALRERLGIDAFTDLVDHVYIISMFRSETPIFHD